MELFTPVFYWIFLGLFFIIVELFFPSFFFSLSLSLSSFITAGSAFMGYSQDETMIIFMIATPFCFLMLNTLTKQYSKHISYKSNLEENLYHEYHVIKNPTTHNIPKIMYQGTLWSIKEKDNKELHHHDQVKTLYIKGNSFIVTKIN